MTFDDLLNLAENDPVLKKELERSKNENLDTFCTRMANKKNQRLSAISI